MVVFAESASTDSEDLIVESDQITTRLSVEQENIWILQVQERGKLLKGQTALLSSEGVRTKRAGENALQGLIEAHKHLIRHLVWQHQPQGLRVLDPDLEQEAIAAFIDAISRFDPDRGARLGSYAYFRIRASLQAIRSKQNRQTIAVAKSFAEAQEAMTPEFADCHETSLLHQAIALLPKRQQLAIRLYLEDKSYSIIAEQLSLGIRAVQALCYRAKRKLRSLLMPQTEATANPQQAVAEPAVKRWPRPQLPKIFSESRVLIPEITITSSEVMKLWQLSILHGCPSTVLSSKRVRSKFLKLSPGDNQMVSYKATRVSAQRIGSTQAGAVKPRGILSTIGRYLPPLWVNMGLLSVATYIAQNPLIDSMTMALWMAILYLFGISKLAQFMVIDVRHRLWFSSLGAAGIGLLASPQAILAQTGAGSCANAGFLNKLAEFSTSVLTSNTGGAVTNLNSFICQFIGMLALIAIIMMVGGFIYAGFEVTVRQQALATVAQPVVGIVITVIFCVVTIYIMSNPT
ncbi:MAG: sigma-70 family RNA polymerase sigma factor [Thermosynechococcaceae cyanobacterium MS004]|nr:sigma-70 family RNA polymerase sigma factor [Thermosynechococcaceae cyanobacterium MS004]